MGGTEQLEFAGGTGARLSGVLHRPADPARGSVLMAHCFTCSKDLQTLTRLAGALAEAGYAALRFDFTGLGASGGEFTDGTVSANVRDLTAAARTLIERGFGPCGLFGHSLGGAAALLAAHRLGTVRSVAVLGAPASPAHVRRLFSDEVDRIRREGEAVVTIGGREFPISTAFVEDLGDHDQAGRVAELDRPLLVVHAVDDEVVEVGQGERIWSAATQPKAFWPLLDADHLVTGRDRARELAATVTGWFDRTL